MTTVLITGAGGHVGRRVTRRLAADGIGVRAVVRSPRDRWPNGVDQILGDVAQDADAGANGGSEGVDLVIHLAGASEEALRADPRAAIAASVTAAERVATCGAPGLVYLSTVHVYGSALLPGAVICEATATDPLTGYAQARLACEEVLRNGDTPSAIFRLTNGLGAPLDPDHSGWQTSRVQRTLPAGGDRGALRVLRSSGVQWREDFVPLVDVEASLSKLARQATPIGGTYNFVLLHLHHRARGSRPKSAECFAETEGRAPTLGSCGPLLRRNRPLPGGHQSPPEPCSSSSRSRLGAGLIEGG